MSKSTTPADPPAAMLLAAGRGMRMRPLTDHTPKPLLQVHGKPLLLWPMQALWDRGVRRFVVNTAWLGEQLPPALASWAATCPGANVQFSHEAADFGGALETAGGIARALPMLGDVFWVLAGDVYAPSFDFDPAAVRRFRDSSHLAHLWLVPNPAHNPTGDFGLDASGLALNRNGGERWTFSTIGLYRRALFESPWCDIPAGNSQGVSAPLAPLLRRAMDAGLVSAEVFRGPWTDVGTPGRLAELNASQVR
ncbi:MAG: nucleotidyltransferase family protein [Burkholderiaceae bacterium]